MQGIVGTMKSLVPVVQDLHESARKFLDGSKRNIIHQNLSEDWNLLDGSFFAVRFSLLLVESHLGGYIHLFAPKFRRLACVILSSKPAIVKPSHHFILRLVISLSVQCSGLNTAFYIVISFIPIN